MGSERVDLAKSTETIPSLWQQAFESLSETDKDDLRFVHHETYEGPASVLKVVTEKSDECARKQWVLYTNKCGEKVTIREVLTKVCDWIERFKEVGDTAISFDPGHAAIPWVVVRTILQMAVNDCQTFGRMLESLEVISSILARYAKLEARVLIRSSLLTQQLSAALVKLYTAALRFLADARRYYGQSSFKRVVKSTIHTAKSFVEEPMLRIEKYEDDVYKLVCLVQNECMGIKLDDILESIKQSLATIHASNEEQCKRLSAWINGMDTKNIYETALQYHHDGTCEWVLKLRELEAWGAEKPSKGHLLWIHGPAGFGKTFMSAWIIRHLKEQAKGPLSYFFCVADNQATRDPYSILRCWLTQILGQDEAVLAVMEPVFHARNKEQTLTNLGLWELFVAVGESIPGCTFIIDGFDECTHIDSGARYHQNDPRNYFLRDMIKSLKKTKSRVLVVSRDVPDIREYLGENSTDRSALEMFEYGISAKDTAADVKSFSKFMVNTKLPRKSPDVRQKIAEQAAERSEGMFLWIKLLEKEISPGQNAKELTTTVREMPSGISEAYSRELEKIAQLPQKQKVEAVMILRWVLFAVRPLQVKELAEALIVSDEELDEYPEDDLPDTWHDDFVDEDYVKERILGRCGSLLQLRSDSPWTQLSNHTVHFVHFSVKEYLSNLSITRTPDQWAAALSLDNGTVEEIRLSNICLRYLTLNKFTEIPPNTDLYPFLSYASWAWYFHSFMGKPPPSRDIMDRTQKAFDPASSSWKVWTPLMEAELTESDKEEWEALTEADFKSNSSDTDTPRGSINLSKEASDRMNVVENPIYYASLLGLIDVVKWLGDKGLDCDCTGGHFGFPLQAAVARNHEEVVRYLLHRDVNVSRNGGQYSAAIIAAAALSSLEVVEMLLTAGADLTAMDGGGWTALHHASTRGAAQMAKRLVERGADINAITLEGKTAASLAAGLGHKDVLSVLLANGANITIPDKNDMDPLQYAIFLRHDDLACMLLDNNDRADAASLHVPGPLHLAIRVVSLTVVKRLIKKKVELSRTDETGWTPLQLAVSVGDIPIIKALTDAGADVSASFSERPCPLHIAAANNNLDVIKILHELGADLHQKGAGGFNAVMMAVANGRHEAVETLLDLNASLHGIYEHDQETIFDLAVHYGETGLIELLLRRGCFRTQHQSGIGKRQGIATPFIVGEGCVAILAYMGHVEEIENLIGVRGNDFPNHDLSEGLFAAAAKGHLDIVRLLLNKGVSANEKDINRRTALHYAAFYCHNEVADLLIERGGSISVEDDIGSTPIDLAVHNGMRAVGFIGKHMDGLTLNISRRPSLLEATKRQTGELSPVEIRDFISGAWTGHYECLSWLEGRRDAFSIEIPEMEPSESEPLSSRFSSSNEDVVGPFKFHGFIDRVGTVWFVKLYPRHGWLYRGILDPKKQILKGSWGSNRKLWFGTFELSRG